MILSNLFKVSAQIKSAVPKKIWFIKFIFVYFCLIITAFLEMLGLGSIPVFIALILDPNTSFEIININISLIIKDFFDEKIF